MTDVTIPTTDELWQILQEERAQRSQLQREMAQLRAQLDERQARTTPLTRLDSQDSREV